jgi:hypothetical protein
LKVRTQYPAVALFVAAALLLGGMPIVASEAAPHSCPAFTLDICHPLQAVNAISAPCNLPILRAEAIVYAPGPSSIIAKSLFMITPRPADAPDPPPPKTLG